MLPEVLPFNGSLLNVPAIAVEVSPILALSANGCDVKPLAIKS